MIVDVFIDKTFVDEVNGKKIYGDIDDEDSEDEYKDLEYWDIDYEMSDDDIVITDEFKINNKWVVSSFISQIRSDHVVDISRLEACKTRRHATEMIEGSNEKQFAALYDYGEEIKASNPRSMVEFYTDNSLNGVPMF
ncbi:hypothetical protein PanWU01x14_180230 [Parasponia andersonii]|uniref:Uncharacterized protein n=1 Tax=Parasponia andersonii TaxID=3476 RepID=A0A2P5C6A2_PARAD|nr:hypothetical protein PanWU01x14_180230 [Parasponia andersonii]